MRKSFYLIFIITLVSSSVIASDWVISPTILYSNKRVEKGALIWNTPFMITAVGINYKDTILIGSGGLSFRVINSEKHKFSLSYGQFNDDEARFPLLFYLGEFKEDYKNDRKATTQLKSTYQFIPTRKTRLSLEWEKDLSVHYQNYYSISLSQTVFPLISIDLSYGYGDQKHNKYMYGDTAHSGPTHIDYGLGVFLPFLPFKGMMRIMYGQSQILDSDSVNGEYIRGASKQDRLMMIAFWVL